MTAWLAETLAASTILMLVVLALRVPVARVFGAQAAYALWLLPALRMILPVLPAEVAARSPVPTLQVTVARIVNAAPPRESIDWPIVLAALWAIGAVVFLSAAITAYRRFLERIGANHARAGSRDGIPVYVSPEVDGPVAVGLVWPAIVLPADHQARFAPAELELALKHEAAHHARHDPAANAAALLIRAAHWFNPVAAVAHRAFRADQEMACDARVLAARPDAECDLYARALVKSASGRLALPVCALGGGGGLKRRVKMLGLSNSKRRSALGLAAAGTVIAAGLALTASGGVAAETATAAADQMRTVIRGDTVTHRRATRAELIADAQEARQEAIEEAAEAGEGARDAIADARYASETCRDRTVIRSRSGRRVVLYCDAIAPVPPLPPVPPFAPVPPLPPLPPVAAVPSAAAIAREVRAAMPSRVEIARMVREGQRAARVARASIPSQEELAEIARETREAVVEARIDAAEARRDALEGLREARADIVGDEDLSASERTQALASIDRAISRMERNAD